MLAKRIIPCLDVRDDVIVKGVQFQNHEVVGDIISLSCQYCEHDADELVFYDITASGDQRVVSKKWIDRVAQNLTIPFCVAGGIKTVKDAEKVLNAGADKISINSPALENPQLINELVAVFGQQCVVIGIDSQRIGDKFCVYQYTGNSKTIKKTERDTFEWMQEVQDRGAGEIVLNCMNHDGVRTGYDLEQLSLARDILHIPLIASGGAGEEKHFLDVFQKAQVDGALAATVFHKGILHIPQLKEYLIENAISIRPSFI